MLANESIPEERYHDLNTFIDAGRKRLGLSTCDYLYWAAELGEAMFRPGVASDKTDDVLSVRYVVQLDEERLCEYDHRCRCPEGTKIASEGCPNCAAHDAARVIGLLEEQHIIGRTADGFVANARALGRLGTRGLVKSAELIRDPSHACPCSQ